MADPRDLHIHGRQDGLSILIINPASPKAHHIAALENYDTYSLLVKNGTLTMCADNGICLPATSANIANTVGNVLFQTAGIALTIDKNRNIVDRDGNVHFNVIDAQIDYVVLYMPDPSGDHVGFRIVALNTGVTHVTMLNRTPKETKAVFFSTVVPSELVRFLRIREEFDATEA